MDLTAVYTFVTAVDEGQFQEAATSLSITPQAVSKRIAVLEKDHRVGRLLRRTRHRVRAHHRPLLRRTDNPHPPQLRVADLMPLRAELGDSGVDARARGGNGTARYSGVWLGLSVFLGDQLGTSRSGGGGDPGRVDGDQPVADGLLHDADEDGEAVLDGLPALFVGDPAVDGAVDGAIGDHPDGEMPDGQVALGGDAAPEFEDLEQRGDDPGEVLDDDLVGRAGWVSLWSSAGLSLGRG
ncbi:LysR family transcriptional regulator [Streptomyces sp. NPDC056835]|uniref:LysR family transcriptional regulator n=1 Tax=Streptomyces sp. NPDC056835 TaxID=3345956 RepID=UPI0036C43335